MYWNMDTSGENSRDSVELDMNDIQVLTAMQPSVIPTADILVSDPHYLLNGQIHPDSTFKDNSDLQPTVVIVEQPQQRGFRFRYECEGPSHGGLQGEKTERGRKTHPAIKIENYCGPARIVVSLVTDEPQPRAHAHKLVGKNCNDGICTVELQATSGPISFPNLCVLHVTRKKAAEVLLNRILESKKLEKRLKASDMSLDPKITAEENMNARKQAQEQSRNMSLNVVRLCFEVFLPDATGQFCYRLNAVCSQAIYDSKSPGASALKICRMDKYGGCCTGNEEVFLLCEKVQKEDIAVRFVEHNEDGTVKWEAYGNFSPLDVHRQYAIVFKTPAYYNANIDKAVNVMIMLQRKTDAEVSEAKAFTYYPQNKDKDLIARKKRKKLPLDSTFNYYGGGGDGPGGGAPGGGGMGGGGYGHLGGGGREDLGGGSGTRGPNSYSVMLPNGNIVDQLGVLPATVEQVVKEEFARHSDSPDQTSTDDSNQSAFAGHYSDPMMWSGTLPGDLEMDAAPHSLRPPVRITDTTGMHFAKGPVCSLVSSKSLKSDSSRTLHCEKSPASTPLPSVASFKPDNSVSTQASGKDTVDGLSVEQKIADTCLAADDIIDKADSVLSSAHTSMAQEGEIEDMPLSPTSSVGDVYSKRDSNSRSDAGSLAAKISERFVSESVRTDEGFSEASEEASLREEGPKKTETRVGHAAESSRQAKQDIPVKPLKEATAVVKRIMEQITARMVKALQDYSETGEVHYLLMVQRHLTMVKNENGDLPVHLAIINNQIDALQQLLDVMTTLPNPRAAVNTYNYLRQTPLHLAAIMQEPLVIEMLLHAGADPSLADRNGNTPAHLAVINNSAEALRTLVKYLRPGVTAAKPFPELNYLNYDGYTPVHLAAQSGNVDLLKILVHGRANVDVPDGKSGRTALHHAVEQDDLPVAGYLLMEANADVNARCFDGNTPLHIACGRGLVGMVALLMTAGANPDLENEEVPSEDEQAADSESDESEDNHPRRCRRGLQPIDYAAGNDKIIRVLKGDQYLSQDGTSPASDLQEDCADDTTTTMKSGCDSGLASIPITAAPGDMELLVYTTRVELSVLLDKVAAGKDVFTLAEKLGYDNLTTALEVMGCSGTSPTRFLLDYHETADGKIGQLVDCLWSMGREDAVELIKKALPVPDAVKKNHSLQHSLVDSGCI